MEPQDTAATRYFAAMNRALNGLDTWLNDQESPLYKHDLIGAVVTEYLGRLRGSLTSWQDRIAFTDKFRISRAESGFPVYQNLLELENDRREAKKRLAAMPDEDTIRKEMVDFILTKKAVPTALQRTMSERRYLTSLESGKHFSPLCLPRTIRVSVNPKTGRPYYIVHWGYYDGTANLPMVYIVSLEDSSTDMVDTLVGEGKLKRGIDIPLPVEGLLNPVLAHQFDDFCDKNSAYSLTLATIATSLDKDFPTLHPKQLRRIRPGAILPFGDYRQRRGRGQGAGEGEASGEPVDADLDAAGNLFDERKARQARALELAAAAGRVLHQYRQFGSGRHGRFRFCQARAGATRGVSGDLCRGAGGDDLRRIRDAHYFGRQGSAEDLNRWTSD